MSQFLLNVLDRIQETAIDEIKIFETDLIDINEVI